MFQVNQMVHQRFDLDVIELSVPKNSFFFYHKTLLNRIISALYFSIFSAWEIKWSARLLDILFWSTISRQISTYRHFYLRAG